MTSIRTPSASRPRALVSSTLVVLLALAACERPAEQAAAAPTGHVLTDMKSGIAVDLPRTWKDRYRLSDSLAAPETGVERQLTLRFIKADSSVAASPLLVIRVITATVWDAMPLDTAQARHGFVVARDATHVVAMRPAAENPLAAGTADAAAFDSLMFVVIQRPMRVSLRR